LLPAGVLQPNGADIVFACNSVPGPADGNPLGKFPGGRWLRWRTPIGRLLDGWVSGAFLFECVADQASRDADVLAETTRVQAPLLEQPAFILASCLASKYDARLESAAQDCLDFWKKSSSGNP
jgi:hypothetical protein